MGLIRNASIFVGLTVIAVYFYQRFATGKATSVIVQAFHYLARQHVAISNEHMFTSITLPSAWNGTYMAANPQIWTDILTLEDAEAFTRAIHHFQSLNKSMEQMTTKDFPLPANLASKVANWRYQLSGPQGRGMQLIRNAPVNQWSLQQSEIFFFALGKYLGIPGAQDNNGTLLGHVKSIGHIDNKERPYRQTVDIAYHCDGSDVVGLLCIHPAKEGGISRIISSVAVYNQLLTLPQGQLYAHKLFREVFLSTRATFGLGLKFLPIVPLKLDDHGVLRTYWNQEYFLRAYRHANGSITSIGEADPIGLAAVEAYDNILAKDMIRGQINRGNCTIDCSIDHTVEGDELGMDMILQAGDIQLISNHFVLHARTEFTDYSDEEIAAAEENTAKIGKRELLRLWLSHPNSELTWKEYMSKQWDLMQVLAGVVRALVFYR